MPAAAVSTAAAAARRRCCRPQHQQPPSQAKQHPQQPQRLSSTCNALPHAEQQHYSRSGLLRGLAASSLLLAAGSAALQPPAAIAAVAAAESAQQVVAAAAASVAAVSAIPAGQTRQPEEQQLGSAIVWDQQHVVTSYAPLTRVLRQSPAGEAQVLVSLTAADGSSHRLPAAIVARDPSHELIVLRVEPPAGGLRPIALGSSAGLRVGQDALLVGALPGGEGPTLAAGIVSATGRTIPASNNQPIPGALQTDADVNSQSLGGALLDSGGRLIGMPVVSYAKPGVARSSGVNFAVSADMLREVVPRLIVYASAATRRPTEQLLDLANPSSCPEIFLGNLPSLLAAGADLAATEEPDSPRRLRGTTASHGGTALHLVANNGWPRAVAALLRAGADVRALDNQRLTPLHAAAAAPALWLPRDHTAAGKQEAVALLLAAGADPNAQDASGAVPALLALRYLTTHEERMRDELCGLGSGFCPAVSRLLNSLAAAGASLDIADEAGCTPRQLLVAYLKGRMGGSVIDALLAPTEQ
ncbi:protease Do-like chloroplastic [Chlorella sorokiniana]|uniref:Protease Do-like chloroplastic n=1 Tax=Chlorella sorokiniana TaxID=3076 RepID=A0A2P6TWA8_CHLSO|nr:protease Do-like chloroplastic [Chlorella sorokiniana]|eukprot:PRW58347.1 protease Do-like chloroplastic [Chlorella sorokiniana]